MPGPAAGIAVSTIARRFVRPCRPRTPSRRCARRSRRDWIRPPDSRASAMPLSHGEFFMMPSEFGADAGVKVLTIVPGNPARNIPVIQGLYILFDAETGTPTALLGRIEMTAPAHRRGVVAAVRDRLLAGEYPLRVVVFGAGIQARSHLRTSVRGGRDGSVPSATWWWPCAGRKTSTAARHRRDGLDVPAAVVGIGTGAADRAVAEADLMMCTTRFGRAVIRRHPGPRRRDGHLRRRARTACARSRRRVDRALVRHGRGPRDGPARGRRGDQRARRRPVRQRTAHSVDCVC